MHTHPTALVTGASSGIGRELCRICALEGWDLVIVARRTERLVALKKELEDAHHVAVHHITADLLDPNTPGRIKQETDRLGITVDLLVNDAGYGAYGDFTAHAWEDLEGMVRVNLLALMHLTHLYLPPMIAQKHGRILNIGSMAGYLPGPSAAVYHAGKAAVISFSEALWEETRKSGVTVTCLNPGLTKTEFHERAHAPAPAVGWMSATRVAEIGYAAVMRNKRVVDAGLGNTLLVRLFPFIPRRWLLWGARMG